jgi:DNA-binding XRE family transcriptional regulator
MTTQGCHTGTVTDVHDAATRATLERIKKVRAAALEHMRKAMELSGERRKLIQGLIDNGLSQAEIARELGVTRQAIQKMLAC